jgi:branched-chain amino acid transport system substrate-binding protein
MGLKRSPIIPVLAAIAGLQSAACIAAWMDPPQTRVVPIAFIDPLSGPFANAGESALRHFRAAFEGINARGGAGAYRFEIVPLDSKGQVQEALGQLRRAADQGVRYVAQGQSSAVALALSEAISKHNARDPARSMLLLNYAALDPELTNAKCSFWHFRFDASSDMRVEALASLLERERAITRLFIIGQNYSFGQQVSRAVKEALARRRPDIHVVGDELHPLGQVKDFAPYVAKIRASGAQAVITGNWGNDLALLIRAARQAALDVRFYTFYAGSLGAVTAIGESGAGRVTQVNEWHSNVGELSIEALARAYKARFGEDYYFYRINTLADMLAAAIARSGSPDPLGVAWALEGMRHATPLGGAEMRAADHQLLQPLYLSTLVRTEAHGGPRGVHNDVEGTGLGFRTDARIEAYVTAQPTSCAMSRPSR